jgi:hypothetical protein
VKVTIGEGVGAGDSVGVGVKVDVGFNVGVNEGLGCVGVTEESVIKKDDVLYVE